MEETYYLEKDRIPVFIGKQGEMKKQFEKKLNCSIDIDSNSGKIITTSEEPINNFILGNIIQAVNGDLNPNFALKLCDENYVLDVLDVRHMVKKNEKLYVKRAVGRIIGLNGATRKVIEEITKCFLAIKDNYVTIVGPYENTILVQKGIEMICKGVSHKGLYKYLERNKENMETGLF